MLEAGSGSIINISSSVALSTMNSLPIYAATKWAILGLTKTAALELGHKGIRVNSIHPGGVDTLMGNVMQVSREEYSKQMVKAPLQRASDPSEIASGILFFASDEGSYCTGAELAIDGGLTAGLLYEGLPGHPNTDIKKYEL
jgi:3alpha(or 20beta)-hydroxysteroid dehydrogenase